MRPEFVTNEDVARWDDNIDLDVNIPSYVKESAVIREIMYGGIWMGEQLLKLGCSPENVIRLQFTAGRLCFGRDSWEVFQEMLDDYQNDRIEWETDYDA